MITKESLLKYKIKNLLSKYPFLDNFFKSHNLSTKNKLQLTVEDFLSSYSHEEIEENALDTVNLLDQLIEFINQMLEFLGENKNDVESITIIAGKNKSQEPEGFESITINQGEIISIVGPTGSGKSRLLGDIEWVAQKDTPTARSILINNAPPESKWRFSISDKLVAQLSQNMNFVMDLTVGEFIELHAESRMIEDPKDAIDKIFTQANELAGEPFELETSITALSGGQSRALMIADTAILSRSPIILIDEIENAGIDRKKALELLIKEEKIVLMATHDPILALMADKRLIIKNGGIEKIINTTEDERSILSKLETMDKKMQSIRTSLRLGEKIEIKD